MARKKSRHHGIRSLLADQDLAARFGALRDAAMRWSDGGSIEEVEIALDALQYDMDYHDYPPLQDDMKPEARIAALAARFVNAAQFSRRLEAVSEIARTTRDGLRDELIAAMSEPANVPAYAAKFFQRLQAEGVGQLDLHPASRALARAVADAIRDHNQKRRSGEIEDVDEDYSNEPLASWRDLPKSFSGLRLKKTADAPGYAVSTLPPFTDIAKFTPDGRRPEFQESRLATYRAWTEIIDAWRKGQGLPFNGISNTAWAVLLAHRLDPDDSDVSAIYCLEIQSPWEEGAVVRFAPMDEPDAD